MHPTQIYYGTKRIAARLMTRLEYNTYRGWTLPADKNSTDQGYLVEYVDSRSNHDGHQGYISWSPKDVFEEAYQPLDKMNFSHALTAALGGQRIARAGWNGKDQWVCAGEGATQTAEAFWNPHTRAFAESLPERRAEVSPYLILKTTQGTIQMGWAPSQGDMFAQDWQVLS